MVGILVGKSISDIVKNAFSGATRFDMHLFANLCNLSGAPLCSETGKKTKVAMDYTAIAKWAALGGKNSGNR